MFTKCSITKLLQIMHTTSFPYSVRQAAWQELCLRCAAD